MSFGWSAGDIASAIKLLIIVGKAAKEAFGDSSKHCTQISSVISLQKTLQTIQAFDGAIETVEVGRLEDLHEQCRLLQDPVKVFLDECKRFEPALTKSNVRSKILSASRRLRWAIFLPDKIKALQERTYLPMLSINAWFGLQTMEIVTLHQSSIPLTVREQMSEVLRETFQLDTGQALGDIMTIIMGYRNEIQSRRAVTGEEITQLIQRNSVRASDDRRRDHTELVEMIQSTINGIRLLAQKVPERETQHTEVREDSISSDGTITSRIQSPTLHHLNVLSDRDPYSQDLNYELTRARDDDIVLAIGELQRNILRCALTLVTILQIAMQKLALILIPYIAVFQRRLLQNKWQLFIPLIGDKFRFEDGLGRTSALSCADFQHWENFYSFLKRSFKDVPGISHVRSQRFEMTNGYNGSLITPHVWQVVIQPKARINMAMLVKSDKPGDGSCPVSGCTGSVTSTSDTSSGTCTLCGKHIALSCSSMGASYNVKSYSSASQKLTSRLIEHTRDPLQQRREPFGEQKQHEPALIVGTNQTAAKNSTNCSEISYFKRIAVIRTYIHRRLSNMPQRAHPASFEDLPTELHFMIFRFLDRIDSCCLGLVHHNLYITYRAFHGTKMPLNTRRIGPNSLESAWVGTGRQGCKQCGIHRCELHSHLRTWMPLAFEYCFMKQNFGPPAKPEAHSTCYRSRPSRPRQCGRHPERRTMVSTTTTQRTRR